MPHNLKVILVVTFNVTVFMITVFPMSLIAAPFGVENRLKITSSSWKFFSKTLFKSLNAKIFSIDLRDIETKKISNPPGLYISNHQSLMDIPLLLSFFQSPPIMKKSILYIPIFGLCAYATGCVCVDRKSSKSRKEAFEKATYRLHHYHKGLQVYPEGTRNREADSPKNITRIKKPLIAYAYKNNISVHAVSIYGSKGFFDKKDYLRFNRKVGIKITDKILPGSYENENDFISACWSAVEKGYAELEGKLNSETI